MFFFLPLKRKEVIKLIAESDNRVSYNGNGTTTVFNIPFKLLQETDLKLILIDTNGNETLLVSDYYVDLVNGTVTYPGYTPGSEPPEIDRPPALANNERLVLYREVPISQTNDFGDRWPFNIVEKALDKLTMICQQLLDGVKRSVKVGEGVSADVDTTIPIEPGKALRWNDEGTKLETTDDPADVMVSVGEALDEALTTKQQAEAIKSQVEYLSANVNVFIPFVDVNGDLSWTNQAGITNPATVNVRGPQGLQGEVGPQGDKPIKGVDYYTETDKQEIVSDVLASLPVYQGEVTIV